MAGPVASNSPTPRWTTRLLWTLYLAGHLRGQAHFAFRRLTAVRRIQARRVRRMISFAYSHVPYYRDTMQRIGLKPENVRTADDLARLPIIERDQLQRDPEYFVSRAQPLDSYLRVRSGGSTGAPRTIYWDLGGIFQNAAHAERERSIVARLVGRFTHYRESVITTGFSSDEAIQQLYRRHAFLPSVVGLQHQYLSLLDPPERNVALLNAFRPDVIRTYGSYLGQLFTHLQATGAPFHCPKVVFYDADELAAPARRLISEDFGVSILSAYQAVEAFKIAFECEHHRGLHLNLDAYPVRIVGRSGETLPPGESGEVIVSNLVNRGTILLNYRLGDVASLLPDRCPCGRTLPLLSFIEGRTDDWIRLPSGQVIHPQSVRTIFTNEGQVREYRVVHSGNRFDIVVVAAPTCDRERLHARIAAGFAERFGPVAEVRVTFVDAIPRGPSGKLRPVESR